MQHITGFKRWCLKLVLGLAALLAGCAGNYHDPNDLNMPAYGPNPPATPPDPDLRLVEFTYEPAGAAHPGDEIVFQVTANHPDTGDYTLNVVILDLPPEVVPYGVLWADLRDDGVIPDTTSGDAIYSGKLTIPDGLSPQDNLPVIARVDWWSTAAPPEITGEPLDILPAGEQP